MAKLSRLSFLSPEMAVKSKPFWQNKRRYICSIRSEKQIQNYLYFIYGLGLINLMYFTHPMSSNYGINNWEKKHNK